MINEFRQDLVSGDWVLFATERALKPGTRENDKFHQFKDECVFEPEKIIEQESPVLIFNNGQIAENLESGWTTIVIPNKFPALKRGICGPVEQKGLFSIAVGSGFHELVVTRDHERSFSQFTDEETLEVLQSYLSRYKTIAGDNCGDYVEIFHNHGRLAGASVYHNHSQIISLPIIPPGISREFVRARQYFKDNGKWIHEVVLEWEEKENKRIVFKNDKFTVLCPYASRSAYEMRIFPNANDSDFGELSGEDLPYLAQALNTAIRKLSLVLDNIDYSFFIHTMPVKKTDSPEESFYRWHIEISPRFAPLAGLELGTNVFINVVDPDEAAEKLRNANV